jgi:PHP family Zn ribbon phosphoesterase
LVVRKGDSSPEFDDLNIYMYCRNNREELDLLKSVHNRKVFCPADGKKLRLGVRDRAFMLGEGVLKSPDHRPEYKHLPPLLDLLTTALNVKSSKSKTALGLYEKLLEKFGVEINILLDVPIDEIKKLNSNLAVIIESYRNDEVDYIAGGGGRYGQIIAPWENAKNGSS